jgi:hypothetical protein
VARVLRTGRDAKRLDSTPFESMRQRNLALANLRMNVDYFAVADGVESSRFATQPPSGTAGPPNEVDPPIPAANGGSFYGLISKESLKNRPNCQRLAGTMESPGYFNPIRLIWNVFFDDGIVCLQRLKV